MIDKSVEFLRERFSHYEKCGLECDGFTRVVHWILKQEEIEHKIFFGNVFVYYPDDEDGDGDFISPHWWIVCGDWHIDFCLRMWTHEEGMAPHGIFKANPNHVEYKGHEIEFPEMNQQIFDVLTIGVEL